MNIPNSLTLLRIFLIPVFVVVLVVRIPHGDLLAAVIFVAAALTDSLDGYLARKYKQITKLGIILDPIADKLLITAALICLVELGRIPGWIAIVILGREFAVSGLRAVKAEEGIIIPASKLGKFKTISQVLAVIIIILENVYPPLRGVGVWAMYIAVAITLISGIDYFLKFKLLDKE
ncbi:MAG TPA: CDP-diacylglycerol--glycerol-3-phosphate 3-phosphatidyltransferase [Syntrophomonas sp.]|jgi:CDP-diacylglycerol--glycerol-3-phosphate 3-phosphatidyltransferase|nr:CDP-diacylglycerol--glycerol-3-phosphate 3-phosphatidyltransferase [Syntrophomonas sp.]